MDRDIGKVIPIIDALVIGAEFQAFLLFFFFFFFFFFFYKYHSIAMHLSTEKCFHNFQYLVFMYR